MSSENKIELKVTVQKPKEEYYFDVNVSGDEERMVDEIAEFIRKQFNFNMEISYEKEVYYHYYDQGYDVDYGIEAHYEIENGKGHVEIDVYTGRETRAYAIISLTEK